MYMRRMLEIGAVDNGFVVAIHVPLKPKKEDKEMICCEPSMDKQYIAKDIPEVISIIAEKLPLLDDEFSSEEEFERAFKKASDNG